MNAIHEKKDGNFVMRIVYDESPISPREDDNLTKMVCFHSNYSLGDEHDLNTDDFNGWDEMEKYITRMEKPIVIKPLYMYEHSGITIKTSPYGCRWDSGQIGFVYIRKEDVRNEFNIKRCGQDMVERCDVLLEGEVEMYAKYLEGMVYMYEIERINEANQVVGIERCGDYYDEEQCLYDALVSLEWCKNNELSLV